jgi:hypothetical protein
LVNDESVKSGSLLTDFDPPVNPSKDIADPEDTKPADWVDESQIIDVTATKVGLAQCGHHTIAYQSGPFSLAAC